MAHAAAATEGLWMAKAKRLSTQPVVGAVCLPTAILMTATRLRRPAAACLIHNVAGDVSWLIACTRMALAATHFDAPLLACAQGHTALPGTAGRNQAVVHATSLPVRILAPGSTRVVGANAWSWAARAGASLPCRVCTTVGIRARQRRGWSVVHLATMHGGNKPVCSFCGARSLSLRLVCDCSERAQV